MLHEKPAMQIAIAKPQIGDEEKHAVLEVLESGMLTQGAKVRDFENAFADYHGVKHGIATNNGTTALTAMLMAHGFGPGDEIIIPAFSFFATASAVLSVGARPVFADIDPITFCLSSEAAERAISPHTKAIMPVHLYGHPANMPAFESICRKHGLVLLEDAAQAHGAKTGNRFVGSWGTAAFSFYPTKNMTTTEGGMILTNDSHIAELARMIRNQGMSQQYYHEVLGYNFRMTDLAAAIGSVQLRRLPEWTAKRIAHASYLNAHLTSVTVPFPQEGCTHVYHQYTVRLPEHIVRDEALKYLNGHGIGARVYYPLPIIRQPVFQRMEGYENVSLPESEKACKQVISLPVHPALTSEELDYIVQEVNALC